MKLLGVYFLMSLSGLLHALDTPKTEIKIPITFSGGYQTMDEDRGRPVVLIAAALKVPPEVFREAFSKVKPAPAGEQPDPGQVTKNKQTLLHSLAPYGVTNDRLDEVSNYYRYDRSRGEMWRHTPAQGYATVRNGLVTGITITDTGSGYTSPPEASLPGMTNVLLTPVLSFGADLAKNGSITKIKKAAPAP